MNKLLLSLLAALSLSSAQAQLDKPRGGTTTAPPTCRGYSAVNTNDVCRQTYKPFGVILNRGNSRLYIQIERAVIERSGDIAFLKGIFRTESWEPVYVTLFLSGSSGVPPMGSPVLSNCTAVQRGWTYYSNVSGTLNISGQDLLISRSGSAFQIGIGADLENPLELGAYGAITLSDGTTGNFAFKMTNVQTCTGGSALTSAAKPRLELEASASARQAQLNWVTNTAFKNAYFAIEKMDKNGAAKLVDYVWASGQFADDNLHAYSFTDGKTTEGDNLYRIRAVHDDGTSTVSDWKLVRFSAEKALLGVSPNPASDEVVLDLSEYKNRALTIVVYDVLGRTVKQEKLDDSHAISHRIATANWENGQYMIVVQAEKLRAQTVKLLIEQ